MSKCGSLKLNWLRITARAIKINSNGGPWHIFLNRVQANKSQLSLNWVTAGEWRQWSEVGQEEVIAIS